MTRSFRTRTSRSDSASAVLALGLAGVASAALAGKHRHYRYTSRSDAGVALLAKKSSVESFMIQGKVDVASLSMKCAGISGYMDLSAVVFFSLGVSEEVIGAAAGGALGLHGACPVFIVDCYGIVGWDAAEGANVELMEEGRGTEYGGVGGNGGTGVVVAAFRGPAYTTTIDAARVSNPGESHMLICNGTAPYEKAISGAVYGGMAKKCFLMDSSTGIVKEISSFAVSGTVTSAVATFADDAADAAKSIVMSMPNEAAGVNAAGYFPCYMRGVNKYGKDGVECADFAASGLEQVRLFGMFAHGELGPPEGTVMVGGPDAGGSIEETPLEKHSMVSVLALL
eukprot:CAMPEP_0180712234 /NCGR_PEP_ID=MMETSP1038_2-20121128/11267_1 /TAXON_ID=632150 /ORGANISM="Azadinium spinosum, Strain 3D9" /LENGTH=339 /DNA_ID=CAMNT_0022744493 /DNA_START=154 /DNA_END=1170 /DNA_ORIENTATION=-